MQLGQWSLALIYTPRRAKFLWVPNTVTCSSVACLRSFACMGRVGGV